MFAYFIAFLNPLTYAASNIIDSHISNNVFKNVWVVVFYCTIITLLTLPILFLFGIPRIPPTHIIPYVVLGAILHIAVLVAYYLSMRNMDTSIVLACFSMGKIFIPVLAFFMVGEVIRPVQYAGFGIIILFSVFLSLDDVKVMKVNKGLWLVLAASITSSITLVINKKILLELDWVSNVFWGNILSAFIVMLFLLLKKHRQEIFSEAPRFFKRGGMFVGNEMLFQVGVLAESYALAILPVIVFTAIGSTQALFILAYSWALMFICPKHIKEQLDAKSIIKKVICFVFIVIGVVLAI